MVLASAQEQTVRSRNRDTGNSDGVIVVTKHRPVVPYNPTMRDTNERGGG